MQRAAFFALLFMLFSLRAGAQLAIERALCSGRENPAGVNGHALSFGWELSSKEKDQRQTAYEIFIGENSSDPAKNALWHSGRVEQSESVNISCPKPFSPGKIYYWKARVWDKHRRVSAWSAVQHFITAPMAAGDWKQAKWIGYEEMPGTQRSVPGTHEPDADTLGERNRKRPVVPYFRRVFSAAKKLKRATVFVSGLGQYELYMNGAKVGRSFLAPGWTNYDKRVHFNTYDVTRLISPGKNAIAAIVGNGFYNINRERYFKITLAYGYPKLIARLKLEYTDGSEENIVTDERWKTAPSPVTFTSIYGGEDYDARLEQEGWNGTGFNDRDWKAALAVESPSGKLEPESDYPLMLLDSFAVRKTVKVSDSAVLVDFGQNISGIVRLKIKGEKGRVVRITPSELITNTTPNQDASGKPYFYSYTLKGGEMETFEPRFSYYGFRYALIEGIDPGGKNGSGRPVLQQVMSLHNRNSAPSNGSFSCSNPLFNRIDTLIRWAIKSNLQSVVTDCPHREKLSWLEQDHLMGESIHYNFDNRLLYRKLVQDMMDAQTGEGLVPDIAPAYTVFGGGFWDSPEWGSSAVILPWMLYRWYNDRSTMEEAFPMMKKYVDYLGTKANSGILGHGLGDWFDYGPKQPGEAQLTPKALTATAIYYYDAVLLGRMAAILGKAQEAAQYSRLADNIRSAFNARFFDKAKNVYATGSQTAMAMPLVVGLVEEQHRQAVVKNLTDSIKKQNYALTAGDIGFHYLVAAFDQAGASDVLFAMNNRDDVPGYGFQLRKGATALTESWPALENVSNNHLMLGHLMEWLYSGLAGIAQQDSSVAYKHLRIRPQPVGDITSAQGSFHSPYGWVKTAWEKKDGRFTLRVSIPVNSRATVFLPVKKASALTENGKAIPPETVLERGSGEYVFEAVE